MARDEGNGGNEGPLHPNPGDDAGASSADGKDIFDDSAPHGSGGGGASSSEDWLGGDDDDLAAKQHSPGGGGAPSSSDWIGVALPATRWIRTYSVITDLPRDIVAGLTVGMVAVPMAMSDALVGGLPVKYGLFASFVPVYIYALFGNSKEMVVGPAALSMIVLRTGLEEIVYPEGRYEVLTSLSAEEMQTRQERYETIAIQAAFLSGLMYMALGFIRFGFLCDLLNATIVSAFTSGAAIIVSLSQLSFVLGYHLGSDANIPSYLYFVFKNGQSFNHKTFLVGLSSLAYLALMKWMGRRNPEDGRAKLVKDTSPFVLTIATIILSAAFDFEALGIPTVRSIPRGFPQFTASWFAPLDGGWNLFSTVLAVVSMGLLKHIATAKAMSNMNGYEVSSNAELVGLGMTNVVGSMFQSIPVMGSISRSGVNMDCGGRTGMSSVVAATLMMAVILLLAPMFEPLPKAVLGAIVISGVMSVFDAEPATRWSTNRGEVLTWLLCFISTIVLGAELGLAVCVSVAAVTVLYDMYCKQRSSGESEAEMTEPESSIV